MDPRPGTSLESYLHAPVALEPGDERVYAGPRSAAEAWQYLQHACEPRPGHAGKYSSLGSIFGSSASFRLIGPRAFFGRIEATPGGSRILGRFGLTRERRFVKTWVRGVLAPVGVVIGLWRLRGLFEDLWLIAAGLGAIALVALYVRILSRGVDPVDQALRSAVGHPALETPPGPPAS